jgi:hypothetical protein
MEENSNSEKVTVISVALKYGLFITAVSIAFNIVMIVIGSNPLISDWKGWIILAVTIVIVVLAHKEFKGNGDGFMTYGQGFRIAFIAFLISVIIGGVFMFVYSNFVDPDLLEGVWQKTAGDMEAKGQNQETIDIAVLWTKKLFWVIYFFFGTFFSALIGLIVPIFTQKKNPEATFS